VSARVECYSGLEYAERPTAVWLDGARLEVAAVEKQWRTPEGKGFRVRLVSGQTLELFLSTRTDEWSIQS
jgi:hypothetical protein